MSTKHNRSYHPAFLLVLAINVLAIWPAPSLGSIADPRELDGNVLWLDASDVDGDFQTGGSFLNGTTWVDKSTELNADAAQGTASARPSVVDTAFNGLSVVEFDGNDFMDVSEAAFGMLRNVESATMIGVLTSDLDSSARGMRALMVSSGTNSAGSRAGINLFDSFGTSIGGTGDFGLAGRRLDSDDFQRIEGGEFVSGELSTMAGIFDYQNGALTLFANGEEQTSVDNFQTPGNTSDTDSLNIRLGADAVLGNPRGFFTGQIAELIVYDRALSATELADVESYIVDKWINPNTCSPANELLGDLDGNGSVEFSDFLVLSANFGSEVDGYEHGDITCDGSVGFDDFLPLSTNFGQTIAGATGAAPVPEPSSGTLALAILLAVNFALKSKRR